MWTVGYALRFLHFLANHTRQFCFDVNKSSYQIELPKFVFSLLSIDWCLPKRLCPISSVELENNYIPFVDVNRVGTEYLPVLVVENTSIFLEHC